MARRGENIRKRKDNRWEGRYTIHDEGGVSKSCSVYAKTYSECKEKLKKAKYDNALLSDKKSQRQNEEATLFDTIAQAWLAEIRETKKKATYVKYRSVYDNHIKEALGCLNARQMGTIAESVLFGNESLSESTYRSIYSVIKQLLQYGKDYFALPDIHVEQKKKFAKQNKRIEALDIGEQNKLLNFLYEDMDIYKMGILLSLSTGLRLGELCALKWSNINFHLRTLHVRSTVQRIAIEGNGKKTGLVEGAPKTHCSNRDIPLSDDILKLLFQYRTDDTYIFCKKKPMEPRTFQNRFKAYLKEAGIEENRNFHILRHTFATNCIECGMDVKCLSEILGHSDVKITLNRYVHPSFEVKRKHMNTLAAILGKKMGQTA